MKKTIFSCLLVLALAWSAAADGLFETVVRASGGTQEAALANAIDEAIRKNLCIRASSDRYPRGVFWLCRASGKGVLGSRSRHR